MKLFLFYRTSWRIIFIKDQYTQRGTGGLSGIPGGWQLGRTRLSWWERSPRTGPGVEVNGCGEVDPSHHEKDPGVKVNASDHQGQTGRKVSQDGIGKI